MAEVVPFRVVPFPTHQPARAYIAAATAGESPATTCAENYLQHSP